MMKILLVIIATVILIKLLVFAGALRETTTKSEYWQQYEYYSRHPLPRK